MANHKSALKRIRSSARRRVANRVYKSQTRTQVKKARLALDGTDVKVAMQEVQAAISQLDKAATKGVLHPNASARRKSRLMKKLAALQSDKKA